MIILRYFATVSFLPSRSPAEESNRSRREMPVLASFERHILAYDYFDVKTNFEASDF
jgi:hypothetical protein